MPATLSTDPRFAARYETLNHIAGDTAFYLTLAEGKNRVIDLGCGTGLLAGELAARGHRVVAIDPASEMLHVARHRREGEHVQWIEGDAPALPVLPPPPLLLMTGPPAPLFLHHTPFPAPLQPPPLALHHVRELAF